MLSRPIRIRHPHTNEVYIEVVRPHIRGEDPWGGLSPLQGTPWGNLTVVSGEVFSAALHGHSEDLFASLGPEPRYRLGMLPKDQCRNIKACAMADKKVCFPHAKVPDCYEAPLDPAMRVAFGYVLSSWKLGYFVVVVVGDEFVFSRSEGLKRID